MLDNSGLCWTSGFSSGSLFQLVSDQVPLLVLVYWNFTAHVGPEAVLVVVNWSFPSHIGPVVVFFQV